MKFTTFIFILNIYYISNLNAIKFIEAKIPYKIKNFTIRQCNNSPESLSFENISVSTTNNNDLAFSGQVKSTVDLDSPIKVSVIMKRKIIGLWVKVPCLKQLGSCTYQDACQFGIAEDKTCPKIFEKNNVPCRCPIKQGTYEISDDIIIPKELYQESVISGKYAGQIIIQDKTNEIGCFKTSFTLY